MVILFFLDDYKRIVKKFPKISGCMIGRGAFINPFITQQIDGKIFSKLEKKQLYIKFYYRQHHHFKQKTINENGFLARMKDLWWYFAQSFEQSETYFNQLKTINELTTFEEAVQQILHTGQLKI